MSRSSSKKLDVQGMPLDKKEPTITPKRGRKVVPAEVTVVTENKTTAKAKSKKQVQVEVDKDDEPLAAVSKQPAITRKINRVRGKDFAEEGEVPKQKTPAKRKAKTEDSTEDADRIVPKKRKTKEEKEAETMPLATRTMVGALKKAMHIGAHVSGAGGKI